MGILSAIETEAGKIEETVVKEFKSVETLIEEFILHLKNHGHEVTKVSVETPTMGTNVTVPTTTTTETPVAAGTPPAAPVAS